MAHPLNRARYDEDKQRVCEGYGILQPRVSASLPGTNRSRYAQLYGGDSGIDPYTRAVSDVYQDVFQEGSFIGKGIYDIDVFERSLKDRFPENRILSHDLLEGCYARAGLLSDVQLYDDYPARYSTDVSRRHRWIRGDWQIARWLWRDVPKLEEHSRQKNPLSALSQWKILDNLRRSFAPAALTLLLVLGWTVLSPIRIWTFSVIGIILIPPLLASILEILHKPSDVIWGRHLAAAVYSAGRRFAQAVFTLACLPYEAFFSLDAIARSIGRMLVTHRRLLEWNPSNESEHDVRTDLIASFRSMWIAPVIAVAATIHLLVSAPAALAVAGPILFLWFASPAIAWWISRPLVRREAKLTAGQTLFLRKLSRKTWAFFETLVGPEDHWLPPDNYQENPVAAVAHRTSPTNMGLALLANLSAYDFGYISAGQLIERTTNALHTMEGMERHRGHFYNWYDTLSLKPLNPAYISSVDSGNLAGHLLTLRPGLLALPDRPILEARWFDGLRDTLGILVDAVGGDTPNLLAQFQKDVESACDSRPTTLATARLTLDRLAARAEELALSLDTAPKTDASWWAQALARQCHSALEELTFLADFPGNGEIPTLRELARLDTQAGEAARARMAVIERLALQSSELARMEYDFLHDNENHLLAIGYNVDDRRRDSNDYYLMASEARFSAFVAIAQGQVPQESLFALGRQLTTAGGS